MGHIRLWTILWVAACALWPTSAAAHGGAITGVVLDAADGTPVEAAMVVLPGGEQGVPTGADGRFRILEAPAGQLVLTVSRLGYEPRRVPVDVADGRWTQTYVELHAEPIPLERTLVAGDRSAPSAGASRTVREFDRRTRPTATPRQLLEALPGLTTVSGGGARAERIFLRGFDNGFGTDVAFRVDGVPVNLVSHGHAQGYADLHFLIPAVVDAVEVYKGPYYAEHGNLANAAQVVVRTRTHVHENRLEARLGSFARRGLSLLWQLPWDEGAGNAYVAADLQATEGPADMDQDQRRAALFARLHRRLGAHTSLDVSLSGYGAAWREPGLVAERAVAAGEVSRFGAHDDSQGGATHRAALAATFATRGTADGHELETTAWWVSYGAELYGNLTFYLLDPIYGDAVEQADQRTVRGLRSRYQFPYRLGPVSAVGAVGGGFRADDIELDIWQTIARRRYWPLLDGTVHERHYEIWGQQELLLTPGLRLVLGLRHDWFTFDLEDRMEVPADHVVPLSDLLRQLRRQQTVAGKPAHVPLVQPHASGIADASRTSPKASLVLAPHPALELFANAGVGFHSNDARSVVLGRFARDQAAHLAQLGATPAEVDSLLTGLDIDPRQRRVSALPRTRGAEVGLRLRLRRPGDWVPRPPDHRLGFGGGPGAGHVPSAGGGLPDLPIRLRDRLNLGAALWWIDVDEEYIFDTDLARPEARGRTRRWGVDLEARLQLTGWLWADADLNVARGRLRDAPDGADAIPLAPRTMSAGGMTARGQSLEGGLRWRHLGDRPATPDGSLTAVGHVLLEAHAAHESGPWRLEVSLLNLLDADWREAQAPVQSVLPGELDLHLRGPLPPTQMHFTAGAGRELTTRLSVRLP